MPFTKYIPIEDFSEQCDLELHLLKEFADFGLISVYLVEEKECFYVNDIDEIERLVRLYKDLNINKEGIDIIVKMRQEILSLSKELESTRYKLQKLEQEKQMKYFEIPYSSGLIIDAG
jgi:hypothetical protein